MIIVTQRLCGPVIDSLNLHCIILELTKIRLCSPRKLKEIYESIFDRLQHQLYIHTNTRRIFDHGIASLYSAITILMVSQQPAKPLTLHPAKASVQPLRKTLLPIYSTKAAVATLSYRQLPLRECVSCSDSCQLWYTPRFTAVGGTYKLQRYYGRVDILRRGYRATTAM